MSPRQTKPNPEKLNSAKVKPNQSNHPIESEPSPLSNAEIEVADRQADSDRPEHSGIKKYWWLLPVLGIVLAIAGVSYVRLRDNSTEETTTTQISPLSVKTAQAVKEPIENWISSEGMVRAVNYKHLAFEVEGDVTYLANRGGRRLREGDRVSQGELLAKVDERALLADVSQAQAAIAEAQQNRAAAAAQVAQAQAQVRQTQSQVNKAQTGSNLAQSELERYRILVEQGAISESEFDSRTSTVLDSEADVAAAQEQVKSAQAQVRAAQEQYKATQSAITTAQARLEQAQVALEGARLYAPFDGVIAYLNITEGEYYSPQAVSSQLGGDYQGILDRIPMVIINPAQYEVITDLAGSNGDKVETGQPAFVSSEGSVQQSLNISELADSSFSTNQSNGSGSGLLNNARARGEVFAVNPAISPGGRAIEATIRLLPETTSSIKHGEQVTTWIAVEEAENVVVVPLNAITYRDRTPYIFVVGEDNKAEQRQVNLGIKGLAKQQVLSGIEPGETIITQGQNRLANGTPVRALN